METKDILASIEETKDLIRRVRTPEGVRRFGQPIGSIIKPDLPSIRAPRKGTRRAASMAADHRADEPTKGRQRGTQRVPVAAAQVAPSPEVAEGSDEAVKVDNDPSTRGSVYTVGQKYVKNEPLIAAELDYEFMKTGTAKEAAERLKAMGAHVEMGKSFMTNREFMTSLAEATRILEQEFPGFAARHGNYFSTSVKGNTGGFNTLLRKVKSTDSNSGQTGDSIRNDSTTINIFGGGKQGSIEAADNNATATVFTPMGVSWSKADLDANMKRRGADTKSHMSMTDALDDMLEKGLTTNQVGSLHVIAHELGHAISRAVGGRMSFEIDGKTDPDQEQRRWYREYYANSRLKFLDEMGVIKWTGKEYVADTLIKQKESDEFSARYIPRVRIPDTKPRRPARNASPEARERAQARIDEWNSANRAWSLENRRLQQAMAEELARLSANGKSDPRMKVTKEDVANGYGMETSSLFQFANGLHRNGFAEDRVTPQQTQALQEMTSAYGASNWMEIEAETWAAYMLNGTVTEGVSKWGEQMHTMYQWWTDDDAEMGENR